jgi:hypothetical protein
MYFTLYPYFIQNKYVPHAINSPPPQMTNGALRGGGVLLRTSVLNAKSEKKFMHYSALKRVVEEERLK